MKIKGIALDDTGDILIENKEIQMIDGDALVCQTLKTVLGTSKGEWPFDWDEGIDYDSILGKKRYSTQTDSLAKQYRNEISQLKVEASENNKEQEALNKLLEKRLDGDN